MLLIKLAIFFLLLPKIKSTKLETLKLTDTFIKEQKNLWDYIIEAKNEPNKTRSNILHIIRKIESFQKSMPKSSSLNAIRKFQLMNINLAVAKCIDFYDEKFLKFLWSFRSSSNWNNYIKQFLNECKNSTAICKNLLNNFNSKLKHLRNAQSFEVLDIFNAVEIINLKALIVQEFILLVGTVLENLTNGQQNVVEVLKKFKDDQKIFIDNFRETFKNSDKSVMTINPVEHIEGATFFQVSNFLKPVILNERDLNNRNDCHKRCNDYGEIPTMQCRTKYCKKNYQRGTIVDCLHINSNMTICPSSSKDRSFDYIKCGNGHLLGPHSPSCARKEEKVEPTLTILGICDNCLCFREQLNGNIYFNMRPITSDISQNKVVTGLRLALSNRIFHIQIQQGTLLRYGTIDQDSLTWVPIENYTITDRNIYKDSDFYEMNRHERSIELHDLHVGDEFLVTGLQFRKTGTSLSLELLKTRFNFESGKLNYEEGYSVVAFRNQKLRKKQLVNPDLPTKGIEPLTDYSKSGQHVLFTHSDIDKDIAQSIVPFLDAQPVVSQVAVPLVGAGIYHRGRRLSGGFVALKMFPYDYSIHLF